MKQRKSKICSFVKTNKSQYSVEFLIFFAILSIVFFGWLIIFSDISENILFTKNRAAFNDIGTAIQTHISLASDLHSGYNSSSLIIPDRVNGNDFSVNNSFYVFFLRSNNQDYIFQIPYTIGKLEKGPNTIWNLGGVVAINDHTPIIRDDGNINFSECTDSIDNDGDGFVDLADDDECDEWYDDNEQTDDVQCDESWCTKYTGIANTPPAVSGTLELRLDPTSIVQAGGIVTQWNDLSGNGRHLGTILTQEPLWINLARNGHDGVSFDGNNQFMFRNGPTISQPYHIFVVLTHITLGVGKEIVTTYNFQQFPPWPSLKQSSTSSVKWDVGGPSSTGAVSTGTWNLYTVHGLDTTQNYIAIDGLQATIGSGGKNFEMMTLGTYADTTTTGGYNGVFSNVVITEILMYSNLNEATDVPLINIYLKNKYQLP